MAHVCKSFDAPTTRMTAAKGMAETPWHTCAGVLAVVPTLHTCYERDIVGDQQDF
jgi:hypothetical protein